MPSNNLKYSEEMRGRTASYVIESRKSATSVAEEMGINTNTVCRWVRAYHRKHGIPTYAKGKQYAPTLSTKVRAYCFKPFYLLNPLFNIFNNSSGENVYLVWQKSHTTSTGSLSSIIEAISAFPILITAFSTLSLLQSHT